MEDINDITRGIFTVVRHFFLKHRTQCELSLLSGQDFETLLRLCLASDTVLTEGKGYKQKTGLAMGNNLAPTLAIIYMNDLDTQIVNTYNGSVFLKRFIDDIFLTWTSNAVDGGKLLTMANKLNDSIEFTIELSTDNKLPYLDVLVSLNSETNKFATMLCMKPIYSQCITP